MTMTVSCESSPEFLTRQQLDQLIRMLNDDGFDVVGPTVDQNAIVYDRISSLSDLPLGWTDQQSPGSYRLEQRKDDAAFGYVVGPHSWKKFLFPPITLVASSDRVDGHWEYSVPPEATRPFAFLGVRACELAAIRIQDRVFLEGPFVDETYHHRRTNALVIAVNCTQAASTCFCTSMKTGPRCAGGFDLALTELSNGFLAETGSDRGLALMKRLEVRLASTQELTEGEAARANAEQQVTRSMDTEGVRELLRDNLRSPFWEDVAKRCLSCTNCTMVCPTCFCSSVGEVSDLSGDHIDRERRWDSCFNPDFSYMHSGTARDTIASRYRQWLTHKLSSWHDQFGTSGCVGCGRCITWCPVGIDLTEEVRNLRSVVALASQERSDSSTAADREVRQ